MLYQIRTNKPLAEIEQGLLDAAARAGFGVIATHDLPSIMSRKGVTLGMDCRIYEVCNPHQAKKVLEAEAAISTALPCRISVYGTGGEYTLATMLPTVMMQAFGRPEIEPVAREVEGTLVRMMDEAAGRRQV
jgi:uncharacterized protein (DUF302 family)